MSDTLNSTSPRPAPAALSPTPPFKKEGLLPLTPDEVARHYRKQYEPVLHIDYEIQRKLRAVGRPYAGTPCMNMLNITLCFDGTNNHEPSDKKGNPPSTSNVARLYHASLGPENNQPNNAASAEGFYRYYIQGVGTEFKEIGEFTPLDSGLTMATGGENRVNWGLTRLLDAVGRASKKPPLDPADAYTLVKEMGTSVIEDTFGASLFKSGHSRRQQALQVPLQALEKNVNDKHARGEIPRIIGIRLYVYGFSRGAAEARAFATWLEALTNVEVEGETCYLFAGIPICIAFLGIFETVAASGAAYVVPFAQGHMGFADGAMRLPDSEKFLERCVHLVAAHEQRACFPLDSIRRKANPDDPNCPSTYRKGTFEHIYPGMHSDIGGGYPPGDQGKALEGGKHLLSQIPLHHMYAEAYAVGAPLQAPPIAVSQEQVNKWPWLRMSDTTAEAFDVSETLTHRFNTWLSVHQTGPLEEVMAREAELITGWRINRFANGYFKRTSAYQYMMGKNMGDEERKAFENLHERELAEKKAEYMELPPLPPLSESAAEKKSRDELIVAHYSARVGAEKPIAINTHKAFEPSLDQHQMDMAMIEFARDYNPKRWDLDVAGDAKSVASILHVAFGGLIYLTNEQDEAEEYTRMRAGGNRAFLRLYALETLQPLDDTSRTLTDLFDEQVHDSRAWFMNSSVLGERELFSDYFRYRGIFFDDQSNKSLSLLATAGQVIGVAIAVASIGLSIKRRDPRYLVGLMVPSLGIPFFRGKVEMPEVSAFDTLTGIALPMLDNVDNIRAFTKDTGNVMKLANALPLPPALSAETAITPELKAMLKAAETAMAMKKADEAAAKVPAEARAGWMDKLKDAAGSVGV